MRKTILLLVFVILLSSSVYALTISNPLPTITTNFNEPVVISSIDASLRDTSNNSIYIEMISASNDNKTVKHQPIEYLDEGNYYFDIQAEDIYGNQGQMKTKPFTLVVPPLNISLAQPDFGITPENPFDITIHSSLPSECRYGFVPKDYEDMNSHLSTNNSMDHSISDFDLQGVSTLYFSCFSDYNNETAYADFDFSLDESIPEITNIDAEDVAELPLETELDVNTDSDTVCAYSNNTSYFPNMTIFDGENENGLASYKTSHSHMLDEEDLEDFSLNTFYVVCRNLAGTYSAPEEMDISVESETDAEVNILSPKQDSYQPAGSVIFNLSTNKLAKCHFSENSENITGSGGTFGTFTKDHHATMQISEGSYKYYFQCLVNTPEGLLEPISSEFIVDATSPSVVYVDDSSPDMATSNLSEFTYQDDRLFVEIRATDNESGIKSHEYSIWKDNSDIYEDDFAILNWTLAETSDETFSILIKGLNLTDGGRYYFKARTQNNAGMWSPEKTSNGITVNLNLSSLGHCYNNLKDSTETDIDCGGPCQPCEAGKSCLSDGDCISNFCNPDTNICAVSGACSNGIKDSTETDIDCGGPCQPCEAGYSCQQNSDCKSNICNSSTKLCTASDSCANNILDPEETDIDCGGPCPPCEAGSKCDSDFDCQSAYCFEGECKESDRCGNNEWNKGEQCDGSTELTCEDFGFEGGTLTCGSSCKIDTSQCIGSQGECGDGTINPGEQCDGQNIPKLGCYSFGEYESGQLSCSGCTLILDRCTTELNPMQDTDNDGMPDACELKYFNCRTCANPDEDPDGDGLTNKEECILCNREGTDPHEEDTDSDGYSDKEERDHGTDPCDPSDYPSSPLFPILIASIVLLVLISGSLYFLYYKKVISFSNKPPFIIFSKDIKSFKDIFGKKKEQEPGPQPEKSGPKVQQKMQQTPQTRQIQRTRKEQEAKPNLRKALRKKKHQNLLDSFEEDKTNNDEKEEQK